MNVHTTYYVNFIEMTNVVQQIWQFKIPGSVFQVIMQLRIEYIHEEQITLCTPFNEHFNYFSDNCQLPTAHSVFKHSFQNAYQLQQHTIEVCCGIIRLL